MLRRTTLLLGISLISYGCSAPRAAPGRPASGPLRETLVAMERQAWESWKTKNAEFYRRTLTDDAAYVGGTGVSTREQIARVVETTPCTVDGYSLSNEQAQAITSDVALLTLRAVSDLTCGTRQVHSDAWVSTVFVRAGDAWRISFHQETEAPKR